MKNYDSIISDNYEKVYDHFKEQDQLRNTSFGFFTTITLGVFGFIAAGEYTVEARLAFILLFIIGILFSVLACRYKYYGNIYSVTMKVLRYLSAG